MVSSICLYDDESIMILIACDPGKNGAVVVKDTENPLSYNSFKTRNRQEVIEAFGYIKDMIYLPHFFETYKGHTMPGSIIELPVKNSILYMEDVHFTHRDGKKQVWSFSAAVERILMAAEMYGIPVKLVSPQKWQGALGLKDGRSSLNGGSNKKKMLCDVAKEMYPDESIYQWNADAYLILRYGEICERE